ncbi:MAG TPA: hypothetical protein PLY56_10465 [Armatimonadota bacterium]|jgi:predicted Holliday junction resolvase-like endonuclease|nr:hypothetical protein [Armatimonadota bacterium]HOJ21949.1 hypothetical protein [Armatimonadota bacterium]HOM80759.1 hypothetical protein [Armatimonadota bacterium]HPO72882.1 hypothetical protein [Armatimonadota bacterium]
MRVIATGLILVALGLSLYSFLEVRRLRTEVVSLRAEVSTKKEEDSREARSRELLKSAEEHSKRAQELIRKGDIEGARREMRKGMELVTESAQISSGNDLAVQVREGAEGMLRRIEELLPRLKKTSSDPKTTQAKE